jgi:hypothetical protein
MLKEVEEDERLYYTAADVLRDVLGMPHLNLKKIRAKKK